MKGGIILEQYVVDARIAGDHLRALRGSKSLDEVSSDTGISRSALNMYELGSRTPRDPIKVILANYYGKSVQDIFFKQEVTNSD